MIKKLTFSAVLFTMFFLTSNSANAGLLDWTRKDAENAHPLINSGSDWSVIKLAKFDLAQKSEIAEEDPEIIPTPIQTQKPKTNKIIAKTATIATYTVIATAYSSTSDQTDSTPCVAASGYNVCNKTDNIIAVSRNLVRLLGYGTQVRFPELYGQEVFQIEDTMNMRFTDRIDFHLDSREEAKNFGIRRGVKMEVI